MANHKVEIKVQIEQWGHFEPTAHAWPLPGKRFEEDRDRTAGHFIRHLVRPH